VKCWNYRVESKRAVLFEQDHGQFASSPSRILASRTSVESPPICIPHTAISIGRSVTRLAAGEGAEAAALRDKDLDLVDARIREYSGKS